jgi:hypothetical protein
MDFVNEVPVLLLHVLEANIAQNSGVVNEDIDAAEVVNGGFDDGLAVLDRFVVGNGFAACGTNGFDDLVCCLYAWLASSLVNLGLTGG